MKQSVSYITIGRITRPHGIRGEVCVQYYAESLDYLEEGNAFLKTEKSQPKPLIITSYKEQGTLLILKIKDINSRTEAEFLRNFDIVIDEALLEYPSDSEIEEHRDDSFIGDDLSQESFQAQSPYLHHIVGSSVYLSKCFIAKNPHFSELHLQAKSEKDLQPTDTQNTRTLSNSSNHSNDQFSTPYLGIIENVIFPAGQEVWVIKTLTNVEILFPAVSDFVEKYDLTDLNKVKIFLTPPDGLLEIYLN